jgi:hypothetical protein
MKNNAAEAERLYLSLADRNKFKCAVVASRRFFPAIKRRVI